MNSINLALSRRRPVGRPTTKTIRRLNGFEDTPALTLQALDGAHPRGRELSFAWLTGTVMTGLTSVLLMGAALYVSFKGQDNFSTASDALLFSRSSLENALDANEKSNRLRPLAQTRSDLEVLAASIQLVENGRTVIRSQQFTRVDATLAMSATPLAEDIPEFDPVALAAAIETSASSVSPPAQIYSANVEGEVAIQTTAMPATLVPARMIDDGAASDFAKVALQEIFVDDPSVVGLAYSDRSLSLADIVADDAALGVAENVTVVPKSLPSPDGRGRSERIVTVQERSRLADVLLKNGFSQLTAAMVLKTLANILPVTELPADAKLRILMGPSRGSPIPIPYRLSIYLHGSDGEIRHAATAALTDRGGYVTGLAPSEVEFPEEDTEAVDVAALPSLYRSIWETARKHDLDDETTTQVAAIFAYEIDLTQKVSPGDGIKLLTTRPETGAPDLLYAALTVGATTRELFRFQNPDGSIDYYSPNGESGKRFLTRRPLQGGGRLASRYGNRVHPIFKTRRLHAGVDLAAPLGTPVYAAGDGTVRRAQWVSGYGRYVELDHVNGYQTAYGHMSRIAKGLKPGDRVRQGQVVGYVGSTGNSTGNHLHYEIRINGRTADPLSVKLPRDKELPAQAEVAFAQTTTQIADLMNRAVDERGAQ